jgi:hypothetical protein
MHREPGQWSIFKFAIRLTRRAIQSLSIWQEKVTMKKYLLSIYHPNDNGELPPREVLDKVMQDVREIRENMKAAGAWVFSGGLDSPGTATVLQLHGRDVLTTDGPFVESKEHIGGITIVQVPDRDAALAWARKLSEVIGLPIEVRPFLEQHPD